MSQVLLIDNDKKSLASISFILWTMGYQSASTGCLDDAAGMLNSEEYQMLIINLDVDRYRCIPFLKEIRTNFPNLSVLALENDSQGNLAKEAILAGATAYLDNNADKIALQTSIAMIINRH